MIQPNPSAALPRRFPHLLSPATPRVLGILNLTPDSFSDGGRYPDPDTAAAAARAMIEGGADMVDIGGESTRPGAPFVSEVEELARVRPVLDRLAGVPFSIDTRRASVMRAALDAGAAMVNDVSALTHDAQALPLIAARGCAVVLMHMAGEPATMQERPRYDHVLTEVIAWLGARIEACVAGGIARERIVVDPGISFGKTLDHNLALLRGLDRFQDLGCPVMLGASRKAFIGKLTGAGVGNRLPGSLALALHGAAMGCAWVRVHDVPETVQALAVWAATRPDPSSI